ncbi:MAG: double zinc ribbon domain-containing protein [bacterium]
MDFKGLGKGAFSLFLPADCKICGQVLEPLNFSYICETCWDKVKWLTMPHCSRCAKPFSASLASQEVPSLLCTECRRESSPFKKIFAATLYEGVMKEAIHLLKYRRKKGIMKRLEKVLKAYFFHTDLPLSKLDLVIPIPLHRKKLKERGFNQAELLARVIATHFDLKLVKNGLQRVKATKSQISLSKKERIENIKGAFQFKNKDKFRAKKILLVDDVYTTGTTVREAAKVLKKAKAREVYILTLARAS